MSLTALSNKYISSLNLNTQLKIEELIKESLEENYEFNQSELEEHIENGMNSRISDLSETIDSCILNKILKNN